MDLLDYLTQLLGYTYLSDLHFAKITPEQAQAILSIPDEQFPLEQYFIVLDYLTGTAPAPAPLSKMRQTLVDILTGESTE